MKNKLETVKPVCSDLSEAEHTPGPWTIHRNIGRKSETGIVADEAPCIICTIDGTKHWPAIANANARLIAAAPDLLAALEVLLSDFGAMMQDNTESTPAELDAIAAIAKARGQ